MVNTLDFVGHIISDPITSLLCSTKADLDNMKTNECHVPVKLYLQNQTAGVFGSPATGPQVTEP